MFMIRTLIWTWLIISSGVHNYQGIRSPLTSVFNLKYIQEEIRSYYDKKLLDYLTFGFPLGRDRSKPIISPAQDNHSSAREWPEAVTEFIKEELDQGALLGPFDEPPHPNFTWAPLLTRPKGRGRRVILDLSFW